MNIEIANRLVNLRKRFNYTQEELAGELGISRQAVSKWERAEASPDTDNLILLSRLYEVSLDELLQTEEEIPKGSSEEERAWTGAETTSPYEEYDAQKGDYVSIGLHGIHVRDKSGSVHVGWRGIHVKDYNTDDEVQVDESGVFVNGKKHHKKLLDPVHIRRKILLQLPIDLMILCTYIWYGATYHLWHPGWLILGAIPLWNSLVEALLHKDANEFLYPVLVAAVFLYYGLVQGVWHPTWVLFLSIPIYYLVIHSCKAFALATKKKKA